MGPREFNDGTRGDFSVQSWNFLRERNATGALAFRPFAMSKDLPGRHHFQNAFPTAWNT
jgi:hypothetical protein